jgi:surfeit locus 1 family protein
MGSFRAPWWAWLTFVALMSLFISAMFWQAQRGWYKQQKHDQQNRDQRLPMIEWTGQTTPNQSQRYWRVSGRFLPETTLLLDNQSFKQKPAYQVWTAFQAQSGAYLLIHRGWVPQNPQRDLLPLINTPAGLQTLLLAHKALPALPWHQPQACQPKQDIGPEVVVVAHIDEARCLLSKPLVDGLFWLHPTSAGGYQRTLGLSHDLPSERHYAYALQWLGLALACLIVFFRMIYEPRSKQIA